MKSSTLQPVLAYWRVALFPQLNRAGELSNSQGKKTNWFRLRALCLWPLAFFYCFGWIENTSGWLHFSAAKKWCFHAILTSFNHKFPTWFFKRRDRNYTNYFWKLILKSELKKIRTTINEKTFLVIDDIYFSMSITLVWLACFN